MNISIITASFPIDEETYQEVHTLCENAMNVDGCLYTSSLNLNASRDARNKGFLILAYDDKENKLAGVVSAMDQMGLNTYEWSILIDPMYRKIGIDEALLQVLSQAFQQRQAEGELAVVIETDRYGRKLLERYGYTYSFSEATFEAKAKAMPSVENLYIRPYMEIDQEPLIDILSVAFGDIREESMELIVYNTTVPGRKMWVAELDGEIVGTVSSAKEGDTQWVTALAVHPNKQGKGIGTALIKWVQDFAFRNGDKKIMLDVEIENERALAVYEKAGLLKSMQIDYFVYGG